MRESLRKFVDERIILEILVEDLENKVRNYHAEKMPIVIPSEYAS